MSVKKIKSKPHKKHAEKGKKQSPYCQLCVAKVVAPMPWAKLTAAVGSHSQKGTGAKVIRLIPKDNSGHQPLVRL